MESLFENGCENEETLKIYTMFANQPHVTRCVMFVNEDPLQGLKPHEEICLEFFHYEAMLTVIINTATCLGEVTEMTIEGEVPWGLITVERLKALFDSMPHIKLFLEEGNVGEWVH